MFSSAWRSNDLHRPVWLLTRLGHQPSTDGCIVCIAMCVNVRRDRYRDEAHDDKASVTVVCVVVLE